MSIIVSNISLYIINILNIYITTITTFIVSNYFNMFKYTSILTKVIFNPINFLCRSKFSKSINFSLSRFKYIFNYNIISLNTNQCSTYSTNFKSSCLSSFIFFNIFRINKFSIYNTNR